MLGYLVADATINEKIQKGTALTDAEKKKVKVMAGHYATFLGEELNAVYNGEMITEVTPNDEPLKETDKVETPIPEPEAETPITVDVVTQEDVADIVTEDEEQSPIEIEDKE